MKRYDIIIIGGGAAGIMCAISALSSKKSILIVDMGPKLLRRVLISGGGRCNFTNIHAIYKNYHGNDPKFAIDALSEFGPNDILNYVKKHKIEWYEKTDGQLFCKNTSADLVNALLSDARGADILLNTSVSAVHKRNDIFSIYDNKQKLIATSNKLVIATGGLAYPQIMVSSLSASVSKTFKHTIIPLKPALTGLKTRVFSSLSGISVNVDLNVNNKKLNGYLLFTHNGISGPVVFNSSLLFPFEKYEINFLPKCNLFDELIKLKKNKSKKTISGFLSTKMPSRLSKFLTEKTSNNAIEKISDEELKKISNNVQKYLLEKLELNSYERAEVMSGGISTNEINPKTMESKKISGLYFIGECLDIAGDLGGFNLTWAFSSGNVCGKNI